MVEEGGAEDEVVVGTAEEVVDDGRVRVEDRDGDVVEGSADVEGGVARVEGTADVGEGVAGVKTELTGEEEVDNDGAGDDNPP